MSAKIGCILVGCLLFGAAALAQSPVPVGKPSNATAGAPPAAPPAPPVPNPPQPAELPPPAIVGAPCPPCPDNCCVPEFKPRTRVIYSCVTREYCQPHRSFLDIVLAKCGLADDCEAPGPTGRLRTKTLLVKKVVPDIVPPACSPHDAGVVKPAWVPPRISVYPIPPTVPTRP